MPEIFHTIHWIDVVFIILLLGMIYKGLRVGVGGQLLSLAGWLFLVVASIGFYDYISEAFFGFLLQRWAKPLSFFAIAVAVLTVLKMLERVFIVVSSDEMAPVERLGGGFVAAVRGFVFFGLVGILLLLVPVSSVREQITEGSRTCMYFVEMDARIYVFFSRITGLPDESRWTDVIQKVTEGASVDGVNKEGGK
ncbi:MAG: hypothetical protein GF392_05100 [Candidatus Omnitrophica bacterium]|nr:hypothetical protein [Candidatus Omnitrophota bacterium]